MKVDLSCPIELWEYALPSNDTSACTFTFFNLTERLISSIQITVTCYGAKDDVLSRRVERPMALEAKGRSPFVVTLEMEGMEVHSIDLVIDKAWYDDGSEWRRAQEARLVDYEPNELPLSRKLEELRYIAGPDAVGYPSDQRHVWICICGRVNAAEERYCLRCAREKEEVFEQFSFDAVQEVINRREQELADKARLAREEASRQEFLRQERAKRKKRNRRMRTVVLCVTLVVIAVTYLFLVLGLPELRYQTARTALSIGDYASARNAFVELLDYRDAPQKIKECDFLIAGAYAQSHEEESVDTAIVMLRDLGAYPGAADMIDEATYQKGLLRMEKNDYAAASVIFEGLAGYRDSLDMRKQCDYQMAATLMAAGDYEAAAERFAALGNYNDAAYQAKVCVYRPAAALMADGKYAEAADMFHTIIGHSDASEQYLEAIYMSALQAQTAGEYEYAAERFMTLGNYGDANTQMKHSIYLAANASRDSGKYEMAKNLYATILDYEDAKEQEQACVYLPAVALMTEGNYLQAAAMFEQVPGYLDAEALYKKCLYESAMAAVKEEDFDAAISLLDQIPDYNDAEKQRNEAKYLRALGLEAAGEFDAAIEAFADLDGYSEAAEHLLSTQYAKAEKLFESEEFALAAEVFTALENYKDAQTRVKDCAYEQALLLQNADDLQGAYDALAAIADYPKAKTTAQEIIYTIGEMQFENGNMGKAAQAFLLAGKYQDAAERRKEAIYLEALKMKKDKMYQIAGELFNSVLNYKDAKELRDETYDLWLSDFLTNIRILYNERYYETLLQLYGTMDVDALPKPYEELRTIYYESNITMARWLIYNDQALEAYRYLIACNGYKNSATLLEKNIYKLLGTWETEDGVQFAFFLNGTCNLGGEEYVFNMKEAYGILIGKTKDELKRAYSFSSYSEKQNSLILTEDATGERLHFTRIKQAEVSPAPESLESGPSEAEMDLAKDLEDVDVQALPWSRAEPKAPKKSEEPKEEPKEPKKTAAPPAEEGAAKETKENL
ncbi:MAG: hypothetical protein FWF69_08165 [Firmicutes bacterium]|nr:hypothetical protein [Bacillota bacterium]